MWVDVAAAASKEDGGVELGGDQRQGEVIFLGTGTSEGVPRVSCLTDPLKKCKVHDIIQQPNRVIIIDEIWCYGIGLLRFIGFYMMVITGVF